MTCFAFFRAQTIAEVLCCESQPGSWLVAICERSENRGSGGGVDAKRSKIGKVGVNFSLTLVWFCRVMCQAAKQ